MRTCARAPARARAQARAHVRTCACVCAHLHAHAHRHARLLSLARSHSLTEMRESFSSASYIPQTARLSTRSRDAQSPWRPHGKDGQRAHGKRMLTARSA
eukprot:3275913-Pleurochrysis_carterae.AAC.3